MALFCSSCQKLSRLLTRRSRSLNDFRGVRNMSFLQSQRNTNFSGLAAVCLKSDNLKLKWSHSFIASSTRQTIYTFPNLSSRSTDTTTSSTLGKEKGGQNVELNDGKDQRKEGSFEDLTEDEQKLLRQLEEEGLTEEERKVLRELEEEERRLREELSSEDYSVWDGDIGTGKDEGLQNLSGSVSEEYVRFENRQRVIQDVIDEMWNPQPKILEEEDEVPIYPRGKTGVFDLGELVDLLYDEKADEIVAITFPKEIDYADYMVIVTVGNNRQLLALATFVRKRFKMKERKRTDKLPFFDNSIKHEGWIALDLGNIILHIFLPEIRDYYDLETLWTVGPVFDDLSNAKDPEIVQLLNTL